MLGSSSDELEDETPESENTGKIESKDRMPESVDGKKNAKE